ncbi:MAG: glycosyltransferase family 39 protein [Terriglobales bacterium]
MSLRTATRSPPKDLPISKAATTEPVEASPHKTAWRTVRVRAVSPQRPGGVSQYRHLLLLAATLAAAALLRFHLLAHKSFWFDEGISVEIARLDWLNFLHLLWQREMNMALYYLLLKFWLKFGISEFFVRSLSVLFGLAAIPVVYALGARLFRPRAGLLAALLLAVNAFHVRYSQEARAYTLLVFLSALCSWLFVRAIEEPRTRNWWLYTAASVLLVYAHFYGLLVVVAHGLSMAALPRQHRDGAGWFQSFRFFAYGVSPVAIFIWRAGAQPMNWLPRPNAAIVGHFFRSLAGNGGYPLLALYALAWILAVWARWRAKAVRPFGMGGWRYSFLIIWLTFPIVAVLVTSQFRSIFLARYLILCLPASVLLAAAGIARLRYRVLRFGMLLVMGALSVNGVFAYYQRDFDVGRDDWRTASRYVLAHAEPGDGVFFYTAPGRMTFEYYRSLAGKSIQDPEVLHPSSGERMSYRDFLVTPLAEVFQNPPPPRKRVWLFLNEHRASGHMDMASEVLCAWHARRYKLLSQHSVDGIDLLLYGQDADPHSHQGN